jgi:hypothetical protein
MERRDIYLYIYIKEKPNGLIYLYILAYRIMPTSLFTSGPREEKP